MRREGKDFPICRSCCCLIELGPWQLGLQISEYSSGISLRWRHFMAMLPLVIFHPLALRLWALFTLDTSDLREMLLWLCVAWGESHWPACKPTCERGCGEVSQQTWPSAPPLPMLRLKELPSCTRPRSRFCESRPWGPQSWLKRVLVNFCICAFSHGRKGQGIAYEPWSPS